MGMQADHGPSRASPTFAHPLPIPIFYATVALAAADGCTRSAMVEAGDTCDKISHKFGASTFQLALVNEASIAENCDNLMPNSTVCLGHAGTDCTKVYTVQPNDTCAWIQSVYGISNETLWSNNPQIDATCSNVYVNEVLCVDTETFAYPSFNRTQYETMAYTYLPWCDE
ncbi:uncharacterized protein MKK02DRAFT_30209 [Dioszegia hungarica]|uniref:LysM domain-containing protein n=1 Tax=Dioszegia hungarica TaxID=4972 RepID=A0AA38H1M5_9TREE|nr:uncharacterized protein MKK02DRAFT_30209 [Dioszegia hungarica]KAI9632380.1 hypothetical protein MKK02DRAFT_30209 [Dioszegia hungarica]